MHHESSSVAGPQAAAAIAGVVFLAVTVPLLGIVMIPLVALAAASCGDLPSRIPSGVAGQRSRNTVTGIVNTGSRMPIGTRAMSEDKLGFRLLF